jgi:hypothetical protein
MGQINTKTHHKESTGLQKAFLWLWYKWQALGNTVMNLQVPYRLVLFD